MWRLDGFLATHPPVDLLAASWLGYKAPGEKGKVLRFPEAAKANSEVLKQLPVRKNVRTLEQMPAFLRTGESLAMIEGVKAQCRKMS